MLCKLINTSHVSYELRAISGALCSLFILLSSFLFSFFFCFTANTFLVDLSAYKIDICMDSLYWLDVKTNERLLLFYFYFPFLGWLIYLFCEDFSCIYIDVRNYKNNTLRYINQSTKRETDRSKPTNPNIYIM